MEVHKQCTKIISILSFGWIFIWIRHTKYTKLHRTKECAKKNAIYYQPFIFKVGKWEIMLIPQKNHLLYMRHNLSILYHKNYVKTHEKF